VEEIFQERIKDGIDVGCVLPAMTRFTQERLFLRDICPQQKEEYSYGIKVESLQYYRILTHIFTENDILFPYFSSEVVMYECKGH
jgi:hypothetical protein